VVIEEVEAEEDDEVDERGISISRGMCLAAVNSACVKLNNGGRGLKET
jgi:hypothetical protein